MADKTPRQVLDKIEGIVRDALEERFQGEYVFDPIVVLEKPDFWGDPHINIYIAHQGPQEIVDPDFAVRLVGIVLEKMREEEEEVPNLPFKRFIHKAEWDEFYRGEVAPWIPAA